MIVILGIISVFLMAIFVRSETEKMSAHGLNNVMTFKTNVFMFEQVSSPGLSWALPWNGYLTLGCVNEKKLLNRF